MRSLGPLLVYGDWTVAVILIAIAFVSQIVRRDFLLALWILLAAVMVQPVGSGLLAVLRHGHDHGWLLAILAVVFAALAYRLGVVWKAGWQTLAEMRGDRGARR